MALVMAFFSFVLIFGRLDVRYFSGQIGRRLVFGLGCVFWVFVLCVCVNK